jgi:TetR/AcrR family transcriptional regulator, repressor for uid operon
MRTANPDLQARRRSEIITAAERCFLKSGFHQTSMQNIAEASGLSMGLLYRYFANKEAIITAVAQQDRDASLTAIANLPVDGDPVSAWVTLLIEMATAASAPDYANLASEILAEANRSPKILETLRANDTALAMAISTKLAEQKSSGAIKELDDLDAAAQLLLLLFDGLTMRAALTGVVPDSIIQPYLKRIVGSTNLPSDAVVAVDHRAVVQIKGWIFTR